MRRFLVISIPIVSIALFILIMLSNSVLKKPLTDNDNIPEAIKLVINDIDNGDWTRAESNATKLHDTWDKVVRRVQFSGEKDEIDGFYKNIARLRGAIAAKDKSNAYMELYEAYEHWENLGR